MSCIKKYTRVLFLTALTVFSQAQVTLAQQDDKTGAKEGEKQKEDLFSDSSSRHKQFGGLSDQFPGLKIRISQDLTDMIRTDFLQYSATYLNLDHQMDPEGMVEIAGIGLPWEVDFNYLNLKHDPISINMDEFKLEFTHMSSTSNQVVYTHLPLINKWAYDFDYFYRFARNNFSGHMRVEASNTFAKTVASWKATDKGYLFPQLIDLELDFGNSYLEVKSQKNRFMNFFYTQTFNYYKYMTMNSMNMFGRDMINRNLPYITQSILKDQKIHMSQSLPQLNKTADWNIDWRVTADPMIHSHVLDLSFLFDIGVGNNSCTVHHDTHDYYYQDFASKYNQIVMSDRVPNCYMQSLADQGWFTYVVSTEFMQQQLGTNGVKINAAYLERAYPWIAERYGLDQELDVEIEAVKPRVLFGPDSGNHIQLKTMLNVGVKLHNDMNYLVYDEFLLETEFDMEILQEVVYANFKFIELSKADNSKNVQDGTEEASTSTDDRKEPTYNPEKISEEDYAEFWNYVDTKQDQWIDYLNEEVFGYGVPLPYQSLSFLTNLTFHTHAVIAVFDLFYQNRS